MAVLSAPFTEEKIRLLRVGEMVEIAGVICTGRDAVHKWIMDGKEVPVDLTGSMLYHCGPVVVQEEGRWVVKAAGPTTSIREEPYEYEVIRRHKLRGIIGKGGMGPQTLRACQEFGCVYLHAIGGAAQVLAQSIREVLGVALLAELGSPEAIWQLRVEGFPAVVTMDARGNSLHAEVAEDSRQRLGPLLARG
jgi:fumarate hydratase class I